MLDTSHYHGFTRFAVFWARVFGFWPYFLDQLAVVGWRGFGIRVRQEWMLMHGATLAEVVEWGDRQLRSVA